MMGKGTGRVTAAAFAVCLIAAGRGILAQQPAQKPVQQPAPAQPKSDAANPFPEDTSSVPVTANNGIIPVPDEAGPAPALPASESDPVRSPDDAGGGNVAGGSSSSSSSLSGMGSLMPPPDETTTDHHRHGAKPTPAEHQETAKEDLSVGEYYLSTKNWRAALSRYQSAMVLAPENPDVYWGLAEAERHTGDFAAAKANYEKLLDYDPDNKHAKEARKLLSDPQIANAQAKPAAGPQ